MADIVEVDIIILKVKQTMLVSSCKSYVSPKKKARFLDGYNHIKKEIL
jgi:hypothetical protein